MRSFSYIASFAALAFATLSSAVPVQSPGAIVAVAADVTADVAVAADVGVAALASVNLERRHHRDDSFSVPEVLQWIINDATPLCNKLTALTKDECTVEVVTGISVELIGLFEVAIGKCNKLIGQPLEIVLRGGLEISFVAKLIVDLLTLVFVALQAVIKVSASVSGSAIFTICVNIGLSLGQFIQACIMVTATVSNVSLVATLVPLCGGILPIINLFGLNILGGLLAGVGVAGKGTLLGGLVGSVCGTVGGVVGSVGGVVGGVVSGGGKILGGILGGGSKCTTCA